MPQPFPVYQNIIDQPKALAKVLESHLHSGKRPLERAAQIILNAKRVVLASVGASYAASFPFIYRLAELGIKVILEDATELLHYYFQVYDRSTVFILTSRSGDTIEIVKLIEVLKGQGATIIGVTNVPESHLGQESDILLALQSPADVLIAIQTWSATVLVLDLLAEQVAGRLPLPECRAELERAVREVEDACEYYRKASLDWKPYFRPYNAIYLLGRGASQASACQGQLLFHEMAWHPATFYTAGHFRHGPWEIIEDGFLGFVFAPQDECYALNIGLAADIVGLQGQLALITPRPPQDLPYGALTCRVAALPKALNPLVEIIPLQFFIYEFAIWKGHFPGEFRISTPITLTEGEMIDADP